MIYNFKVVEGDVQYVVDTEELIWARASSIIASPSIKAAESNLASFVATENGKLIPLGGGRFALEGRKPFDEQNKPQLAVFIIMTLLSSEGNGTCVTFFQANVPVKDAQHEQIKNFHVRCLSPFQLSPRETASPSNKLSI